MTAFPPYLCFIVRRLQCVLHVKGRWYNTQFLLYPRPLTCQKEFLLFYMCQFMGLTRCYKTTVFLHLYGLITTNSTRVRWRRVGWDGGKCSVLRIDARSDVATQYTDDTDTTYSQGPRSHGVQGFSWPPTFCQLFWLRPLTSLPSAASGYRCR